MLALIFGYLELDRTSVAPYHANTRHLSGGRMREPHAQAIRPCKSPKPGYSSHADGDIVRFRQ